MKQLVTSEGFLSSKKDQMIAILQLVVVLCAAPAIMMLSWYA